MEPTWVFDPPSDLVKKNFPDGTVVFDELTNQIHFFEPDVAEILQFIQSQETISASRLAHDYLSGAVTTDEIEFFRELLFKFETLEIVRRLPG